MSHTLKDIAVFFDDSSAGRQLLETAAGLARSQEAHLIGLTTTEFGDHGTPQQGFVRGEAIGEMIRNLRNSMTAHLLQSGRLLAQAAAKYDVASEFRVLPFTELGVEVALHSLYCDLLVVSRPEVPGVPFFWSYSKVLGQTAVPLLIVPHDWNTKAIGRRVTVAWNASRQARRAIADALPLLVNAESVDLLIVDPERKPGLHGEEPGADMAAYLARHEVRVELHRVYSQGSPIEDTIISHAVDVGADLIVIGAYSRPRISESLLGGVTKSLLEDAPLPLFVSH
ncbi:universal stress protein [Achromobacter denitrificans]